MFELSWMIADGIVSLVLIFAANKILWWAVGRRINISAKIVKRKPETKVEKYD